LGNRRTWGRGGPERVRQRALTKDETNDTSQRVKGRQRQIRLAQHPPRKLVTKLDKCSRPIIVWTSGGVPGKGAARGGGTTSKEARDDGCRTGHREGITVEHASASITRFTKRKERDNPQSGYY